MPETIHLSLKNAKLKMGYKSCKINLTDFSKDNQKIYLSASISLPNSKVQAQILSEISCTQGEVWQMEEWKNKVISTQLFSKLQLPQIDWTPVLSIATWRSPVSIRYGQPIKMTSNKWVRANLAQLWNILGQRGRDSKDQSCTIHRIQNAYYITDSS